jgi:hypothetical protein
MSAGGVFTLIANEGKTDRLILATALLNQRIEDIQCARRSAGKSDCWPTLVDIERTHVLFMNAHYKPFVAIGYEYSKVKVQNGSPAFGTTVTFSIPQFGDFFYDMVCRVQFNSFKALASSTPAQGAKVTAATHPAFNLNSFPKGTTDQVNDTGVYYRVVRYDGRVLVEGASDLETATAGTSVGTGKATPANSTTRTFVNLVRWCEYPGNRLFKKVWFNVNNNPLDEYNDVASAMYHKFCVPSNKEVGYDRMCGQEVPHDAWSGLKAATIVTSDSDSTAASNYVSSVSSISGGPSASSSSEINTLTNINHINGVTVDATSHIDATMIIPDGDTVSARYLHKIVDGPQTPKEIQPALDIMHKLHFWFNDDVRLAVPSVAIPYGQRFINMELAPVTDMVFQEPGIFIEKILTTFAYQTVSAGDGAVGSGTSRAFASTDFSKPTITNIEYYPWVESQSTDEVKISNMELYINNIFVNPEIHDIYIRRVGFSLIRVHRTANISVNEETSGDRLISQLKWPIEYLFVGMRPKWNVNANNPWMWRDWHRMTKVNTGYLVDEGSEVDAFSIHKATTANAAALTAAEYVGDVAADVPQHALRLTKTNVMKTTFTTETATVDTMNVTAHGITLYEYFNTAFYNAYIPYHYGGYNISTPKDPGAMMINFCVFPKTYQPSGHLNVSRAREFYIGWTTSYVTSVKTAELLVVASAINFLLISDGSAVLRYST